MDLNVIHKCQSKCISLNIFKDYFNIFTKEIVMRSVNGILLISFFLNGSLAFNQYCFQIRKIFKICIEKQRSRKKEK